jgi:hypothetical protein
MKNNYLIALFLAINHLCVRQKQPRFKIFDKKTQFTQIAESR